MLKSITPRQLFLLAPLLLPASMYAGEADALKHLDQAQVFLSSGDARAATIELKNALREAPDNPAIRLELGRAHLNAGDYSAAAKELSKALELGAPRASVRLPLSEALTGAGQHQAVIDLLANEANLSPRLFALRAQAALASGDVDAARRDFSAALATDPGQQTALLGMARVEALAGKDSDAKRWIREAISAAPDSPRPWRLLGDLEIRQQQTAKALASYQAALKLAPNSIDLGLRTATVLFDRGDLDAAEALLAPLLTRSPQNPALQLLGAAIKLKQGKLEQAATILDPLVSHYSNNASATLYLGEVLLRQKKYERAIDVAQRYRTLRPNDPQGALLLGLVHASGGSADQAQRLLEPLLKQQPRNAELLTALRIAATRQGDYKQAEAYESRLATLTQASAQLEQVMQHIRQGERDTALELLDQVTGLYPDLYQARLLQYREFIRAGQFAQAATSARELTRMLPENARMQLLLGIALAGQKDYPAAQKAMDKAWRGSPGAPEVGHRLALLHLLQKRPEQAEAIYQQVLAEHPDHAETLLRLAQLQFHQGNQAAGLDALRSAVDAAPGELRPRILLSQSMARSGEMEQALALLQELQGRFESDPEYLRRVLQLQMALQQWPAALDSATQLLAIQPESALVQLHLAEIHGNSGDTDALTRAIEQALALDGPSGVGPRQLLQLATLSGDLSTAQALLEGLREKLPADPELAATLSILAVQQQRFDDALAISAQMQNRFPDQPRWLALEVQTLYQAGQSDTGAQRLQQAMQRFPDAPALKMLSAAAALRQHDNQDAIDRYQQVIATQPDNVAALNNLAWLSKDSDPQQALAYSQRAVRLSRHPQVLDTYGMVLLSNKRNAAAVKILRMAAKAAANNAEIQLHLAEALVAIEQRQQARQILDNLSADDQPGDQTAEQSAKIQQLLDQL